MPEYHPCPYFGGDVEVTDERYAHVLEEHFDLAQRYWGRVAETLADPDRVYQSRQDSKGSVFIRWYDDLNKNVLVVTISDPDGRNWLVTAYMTRKTPKGEVLWERS